MKPQINKWKAIFFSTMLIFIVGFLMLGSVSVSGALRADKAEEVNKNLVQEKKTLAQEKKALYSFLDDAFYSETAEGSAGIVPGISELERLREELDLEPEKEKRFIHANAWLKAHMHELSILRLKYWLLKKPLDQPYEISSWESNVWFNGNQYRAVDRIKLKFPKGNLSEKEAKFLAIASDSIKPTSCAYPEATYRINNSSPNRLDSYVKRLNGNENYLCKAEIPLPIEEKNKENKFEIEIEMSGENIVDYTFVSPDFTIYSKPPKEYKLSIHFKKQPEAVWVGSYRDELKSVYLQSNACALDANRCPPFVSGTSTYNAWRNSVIKRDGEQHYVLTADLSGEKEMRNPPILAFLQSKTDPE